MIGRGDVLGARYEIAGLIASGGMGDVFEAHDRRLHRAVAIKVLRGHGDATTRARFLGEARAAARVTHPNVVTVFDVEDGDPIYLVMERLPGSTLADEIARGPITIERAVAIMLPVLDGLEAVHSAGLVHRDVKPSNIFFAEDGTVKLGDFGIAWTGASDLTSTGDVVGTAPYVATERLRGERASVASDVYSAGITLYAALTGAVPFDTDSPAAIVSAAAAGNQVPVRQRRRDVPDALAAAVERAIDPEPSVRFASAASFRDALEAPLLTSDTPAVIPTAALTLDGPTEPAVAAVTSVMPAAAAMALPDDARPQASRRRIGIALVACALLLGAGVAVAQNLDSSADPGLEPAVPTTAPSPTTSGVSATTSPTTVRVAPTAPPAPARRGEHGKGGKGGKHHD